MKIGVVFEGNPLAGGGFHDGITATLLVGKLSGDYEFVYYVLSKENLVHTYKSNIDAKLISFGRTQRIIHKLRTNLTVKKILGKWSCFDSFDKQFERDDIDLVYFTSPNPLSFFLERLNFVIPVWDLCHRDHPEFPEVRENHEFDAREKFFTSVLPKSTAVIAESPFGREALIRRYNLDPDKVHFIWKPPSEKIIQLSKIKSLFDPRSHCQLPKDAKYIFYPAQFWPHKNHRLIIDALKNLRFNSNTDIFAIFCGSDCGNLQKVLAYAKQSKVDDLVIYVGFAPDEHISNYYKQSVALVMPSYFGPTNMPPVEAFILGTPAVVADLPGFKEQIGDAGIAIDPSNPKQLAHVLFRLSKDNDFRNEIITKGAKRAEMFCDSKRLATIHGIFQNFNNKRRLWKFR